MGTGQLSPRPVTQADVTRAFEELRDTPDGTRYIYLWERYQALRLEFHDQQETQKAQALQ